MERDVVGRQLPYPEWMRGGSPELATDPRAPLGHLAHLGFALMGAEDVDEIARCLLADLTALPGVRRVGIALTEGGGRRLRFIASDAVTEGPLDWCHIDAYDDVPLTAVVRTGEPILKARGRMDARYTKFVDLQPKEVQALAAVPLPGIGSPIGGLMVFLDEPWEFDDLQRRLLESTCRRTAEAVRRVRAGSPPEPEPDFAEEAEDADRAARLLLDDDPRSVGLARRFLREFLAESDVSEDFTETAQLCLSELVTNAVVHASSTSELRATLDSGVLTVIVRDRGQARHSEAVADAKPDADADPLRVYGRGLQLVEALADRWGSERDVVGSTVWFVLEADNARSSQETG
jgi:anti-sigma regulatory factor (Ser/Thr protein kinase)